MSQKQACAIFATSFLAGLLVTAVVFQPFDGTPVDTPYFGFPDESLDRTAQNNQAVSGAISDAQSSPPQITEPLSLPNLPNELVESFSNSLRDHLLKDSTNSFGRDCPHCSRESLESKALPR